MYGALVALNERDLPLAVRDGGPEGVDLVVEWKIASPAWRGWFSTVTTTNEVHMRLDPAKNEVRAIDVEFKVRQIDGLPTPTIETGRGQMNGTRFTLFFGRNDDRKRNLRSERTFSGKELREPLQEVAANAGWTWRGLSFGKP